jgi:hypothetical protein
MTCWQAIFAVCAPALTLRKSLVLTALWSHDKLNPTTEMRGRILTRVQSFAADFVFYKTNLRPKRCELCFHVNKIVCIN